MNHDHTTFVLAVLLIAGCNSTRPPEPDLWADADVERPTELDGMSSGEDAALTDAVVINDVATNLPDVTTLDLAETDSEFDVAGDTGVLREICDNGRDDDDDGRADCDDAACERRPVCDHYPAYIVTLQGAYRDGWEVVVRVSDALNEARTLATFPPNTVVRSLCAHRELPLIAFDVSSGSGADFVVWDLRSDSFVSHPSPITGGAGSGACTWVNESTIATTVRFLEDADYISHLWMVDTASGWSPTALLTERSIGGEPRSLTQPVANASGDRVYFQLTIGSGDPFGGGGWTSTTEEFVFEGGTRREVLARPSYSLEYSRAVGRYLWSGPGGSGWYGDDFGELEPLSFSPSGGVLSLGLTRYIDVTAGTLSVRAETGAVLDEAQVYVFGTAVLPGRVGDFDLFFE